MLRELHIRFEQSGEVSVCLSGEVVVGLGIPGTIGPALEPSSRPMVGQRHARWETAGVLQVMCFPGMRIAVLRRDRLDTLLVAAAGQLPFKLERAINLLGGHRTADGYFFSLWVDPGSELLERELWSWTDQRAFVMLVEDDDASLRLRFFSGATFALQRPEQVMIAHEEPEDGPLRIDLSPKRRLSLYCYDALRIAYITGGDQSYSTGLAGVAGIAPTALQDEFRKQNLVAARSAIQTPAGEALALKPYVYDDRFKAFEDFLTEHLWSWFMVRFHQHAELLLPSSDE